MNDRVNPKHQVTGVPGFDTLLGGGLSECITTDAAMAKLTGNRIMTIVLCIP